MTRRNEEHYADTEQGVRALLHNESSLEPELIDRARLTPDPWVPGAWLAYVDDATALLVYTTDHRDGAGFEDVDPAAARRYLPS